MCKLKFRVARVHLNLEKEEPVYENDISAENKTEKEGTWIPQENENKECQKCFNPEHSCAFVSLDTVMTKDMYNHGSNIIKHQEYYLLIYAIAKILFIC